MVSNSYLPRSKDNHDIKYVVRGKKITFNFMHSIVRILTPNITDSKGELQNWGKYVYPNTYRKTLIIIDIAKEAVDCWNAMIKVNLEVGDRVGVYSRPGAGLGGTRVREELSLGNGGQVWGCGWAWGSCSRGEVRCG